MRKLLMENITRACFIPVQEVDVGRKKKIKYDSLFEMYWALKPLAFGERYNIKFTLNVFNANLGNSYNKYSTLIELFRFKINKKIQDRKMSYKEEEKWKDIRSSLYFGLLKDQKDKYIHPEELDNINFSKTYNYTFCVVEPSILHMCEWNLYDIPTDVKEKLFNRLLEDYESNK